MDKDKNGLDPKIVALIVVICVIVSAVDFALYYFLGRETASLVTCIAFFAAFAVVFAINAKRGKFGDGNDGKDD